jgi:Mg-chelatase subunit ChlD
LLTSGAGGAEPKIQILSPKDGARILQEQNSVLINGKVSGQGERRANVDLFLIVDTSGSTAHYAGVEINDPELNMPSASPWGKPQIGIFGGGLSVGGPPLRDLRNSILVAEIAASRRLLSQLNPQTTRIGIITFAEGAYVVQTLTHDFERVKQSLNQILSAGPYGGTNMAEGIRHAIRELSGLGLSERRDDTVKAGLLLTDGVPTLPIGASKRAAPEDTELAINAARIAGKGGIKIHVFALGQEAVSYPRAAVGIARESGGVFTPVNRAGDVLGVLETISVVGVDYVQVINETLGQKAGQLRLAVDGFFSAALPVAEGLNRIQVVARTGDGSLARESITLHYQRTNQRSLDLEVFL